MSSEAEVPQAQGRTVPPSIAALVAPDTGMEKVARVGTARAAFLIAMFCALLAAFAQAYRIDSAAATLKKAEMEGRLQTMSDRQLEDDTRNADRLYQVGRVAKGALEAPIGVGLGALSVLILVWFFKGKVKGRAVIPVAAATLLPGAIANLLDAVSAWRHASLPPEGAMLAPRNLANLFALLDHPMMPPWVKLGNALDFFSLWAAVMMGFGVAAAGEIPTRRAVVGTLVAWVCLRLLTNVAIGG